MGSLGNESNLLHSPNGVVGDKLSQLGGSEHGGVVVESLSLGVVSLERVVPVDLVSTVSEIVLNENCRGLKEKGKGRKGRRRRRGQLSVRNSDSIESVEKYE